MKIFKIILFIIFLLLLAVFGIQNQDYFGATTPLHIDFKVGSLHYTVMELPNWGYWLFCLVIGFLITGIRGFIKTVGLKRQVKKRDKLIESLKGEINSLQAEALKDKEQEQSETEEKQ
ncbi:MAG: hypothetical protein CSA25_05550 [Desulfobacter postgatei]|uniref:Lipopolysaccharide assembly protein A domain-containing protein n=1 Tax=Desulfobacter postgatei TaxID=2293 RepID=A0A2G6MQJ2_9BACT|nr:MAG: hypothetical protein CSA25_05550 [Desulfobacter postgatei]